MWLFIFGHRPPNRDVMEMFFKELSDLPRTFNTERTTYFNLYFLLLHMTYNTNDSALGVFKHYITDRIRELLISNSRFIIHNS